MLKVHHYLAIRIAHEQNESKRSIARRLHHSQKTVAKVVASETGQPPPYTRSRPVTYPKLGSFIGIIEAILLADNAAPLKQRHTSMQIYRRLVKEHEYRGGYDQVRRYVARHRRLRRETLIPLDHCPGERMECDFGEVAVDYPDGRHKTDVLVVTWSFSHAVFMIGLPNQRTESVLHGMVAAFEHFGCLAKEVWWDNPKTIATVVLRGRERVLNSDYAALASHYRFDPRACMPARGQEKPDAESGVKALQRRACTPVPQAKDLSDFNRHLLAFCLSERDRTVSGQSQTIGQRFELEKPHAIRLPQHRFDPCISTPVTIDKYQTATFENNRYSVPRWAAFSAATVKGYVDRVEIVQADKVIACHARSYERGAWVVDPLHYVAALSCRPHALDHSSVFRDWKLPPVFGQLRERLEREHGTNAGVRQYVRVLQLLVEHPAQRVAQAIQRLWHRIHLRSEHIQEKAHQLAAESPSRAAGNADPVPAVKNGSSSACKGEAASEGHSADAESAQVGAVKNPTTTGAPVTPYVQVPRPDLRRFNQLLPSYCQGAFDHEYQSTSAVIAAAAQPQGAEVADNAGRA